MHAFRSAIEDLSIVLDAIWDFFGSRLYRLSTLALVQDAQRAFNANRAILFKGLLDLGQISRRTNAKRVHILHSFLCSLVDEIVLKLTIEFALATLGWR